MSLLNKFLNAIKGDGFRLSDNPPKYTDEMLLMNAEANSTAAVNSTKNVLKTQKAVNKANTTIPSGR
jgi:hypothetical protein